MKKTVVRFNRSERWFHNIVMFSFLFLLVTGLAMIFYNLKGDQGASRQFLVLVHKVVSVAFIVGPVLALLLGCKKTWKENISIITSFGRDDIMWMLLKPVTAIKKGVTLPKDDKFNPGQKMWTYIAISGSVILAVTGVIMWVKGSAILALMLHTATALMLTPALAGHMYMAIFNKDTRPGFGSIVDGEVDAEWAMHHHPLWMERKAKERVRAMVAPDVKAGKKLRSGINSAKIGIGVNYRGRVGAHPYTKTA